MRPAIGFRQTRSQMSLQRGINLRALAEKMGQCSGAEVRGICTEAGSSSRHRFLLFDADCRTGMYALRERRQHVTQEDFLLAVSKVLKKNADANVRFIAPTSVDIAC